MAALAPVAASAVAALIPWLLDKFAGGEKAKQTGFIQNLDPKSQKLFGQWQNQVGNYDLSSNPLFQQALQAHQQSPFGQPFDPSQALQYFQQGVEDPINQRFNRQVVPQLRQNYYSPSSGGIYGSAMDQALNQAATDLSTGLGSLRSNYLQQQQQQHNQGQMDWIAKSLGLANAPMQAKGDLLSQLFSAQNVTPMVQEAQSGFSGNFKDTLGTLGPVISQYLKDNPNQFQSPNFNTPPSYAGVNRSPDLRMDANLQRY